MAVTALLISGIAAAAGSTADWQPVAAGQAVSAIRMVDSNRGWAVGPAGLVMATADGGATWVRQAVPTTEPLMAVTAVGTMRVWVAGARGTILASIDGGVSWSQQFTPAPADLVTALAFSSSSRGFAVTEAGGFMETTDGGATWLGRPGSRNENFWAAEFVDPQHGLVVGQTSDRRGVVLRTSDGGASWTRTDVQLNSDNALYSLDMVSATEAWAGGIYGNLYHTLDGGASWTLTSVRTSPGTISGTLIGLAMTAGGTGWATSSKYGPQLFKTTDHGATWTPQPTPATAAIRAVAALDASHALVGAAGASVLRTTDGSTWTQRDVSLHWVGDDLYAVDFVDTLHGWAVGANGTIVATADGGATWARQVSGTTQTLRSVDFVDTVSGWAVGGANTEHDLSFVLHTADGGATWAPVAAVPVESHPNVVRFSDTEHGFIGTRSGVYATADGGATWAGLFSAPGHVTDLDFPTPLVGYATTGFSVSKTSDGGVTWAEVIPYGANSASQFVDFVDAQTGWVDGARRTTDGGATWQTGTWPYGRRDIAFVDATRGFAAAPFGVTRTIDAGVHWANANGPNTGGGLDGVPYTPWMVHAITVVDPTHAFAVGDDGLILRVPTHERVLASLQVSSAQGTARSLTATVERAEEWIDTTTGPAYPSPILPGGTVTFRDRGVAIGTVALGADGRAVLTSTFSATLHAFSATYDGDAVYASQRTASVVVDLTAPPPTTTTTTTRAPTTTTTAPPRAPRRSGYWMVNRAGAVYAFGDAVWSGNAASGTVAADLEPTATGNGYWIVDVAGVVRAFGDARAVGDAGPLGQGEEVTSLSRTPSGNGYWLFTSKGKVLARGDAGFFGDMSASRLNGPVLDSVPTPDGRGYYMVASDGGVFAFGTARFLGSMAATRLNAPVQSLVPDVDGAGYWLVASDGGIFAFDAGFHGSMGATRLNRPVTGMVGSVTGAGYLMVAEDGGVFAFGDVVFRGSLGSSPPPSPIVAVAAVS